MICSYLWGFTVYPGGTFVSVFNLWVMSKIDTVWYIKGTKFINYTMSVCVMIKMDLLRFQSQRTFNSPGMWGESIPGILYDLYHRNEHVIQSESLKCHKLNIYYVANNKTATFVSFFLQNTLCWYREGKKSFNESQISPNKYMSTDGRDLCKTWTPTCRKNICTIDSRKPLNFENFYNVIMSDSIKFKYTKKNISFQLAIPKSKFHFIIYFVNEYFL